MSSVKVPIANVQVYEERQERLKRLPGSSRKKTQKNQSNMTDSCFCSLFCQAPTRFCMHFASLLCSFARLSSDFSALTSSPLTSTSTASFPSSPSKHVIRALSRLFPRAPGGTIVKNAELLKWRTSPGLDGCTGHSAFPEPHLRKSSEPRSQANHPRSLPLA